MTTERENTPKTKQEDTTMNAKTQAQINRMKEQTIGVEVEMNNITRKATKPTALGTHRDASGNSSAT